MRSDSGSYSIQEFTRNLRIGNAGETVADSSSFDEIGDFDDPSEGIAQSAFDEIDERRRNFGDCADQYPFDSTESTLTLRPGAVGSLYAFLALLSWCGKNEGPKGSDGEKIFEEICGKAAEAYLGGRDSARSKSVVFGFPRRELPGGFSAAIDDLCQRLGEGDGPRKGRELIAQQKVGKIDIVSWVEFNDCRQGKIITFGQCATGRNWREKITELPAPGDWCTHWMNDSPLVSPLRSFFVPHRIERDNWSISGRLGGILYDRCRIASLATHVDGDLRREWTAWSAHVLKSLKRQGR